MSGSVNSVSSDALSATKSFKSMTGKIYLQFLISLSEKTPRVLSVYLEGLNQTIMTTLLSRCNQMQ